MAICKPRSYTLFDLEAPLLLASKYLSHYGLHDVVRFRRAGDFEGMGNVDVVISTFSLLELSPETQEAYFTNLVSRSQLGYVAYNLPQNTPLEVYLKSHGGFETVLETQPGICTKIMWRRLQSLEAANSA